MKQIGFSILMAAIYVGIWKMLGFEISVCCGIAQIISTIIFKDEK